MRAVLRAGAVAGVLTVGLVAAPGAAAVQGREPALDLRIVGSAALDRAEIDRVRQTVTELLGSAGIDVVWHECRGERCGDPSGSQRFLLVLLLPFDSHLNPTISGELVRDPATKLPSLVVYVPRNAAVAQEIRRSSRARAHPVLAALTTGRVVGLTIAHEVGHSLGLGHARSGVMKARLDPQDILDLHRSRLSFPPETRRLAARSLAAVPSPIGSWRSGRVDGPSVESSRPPGAGISGFTICGTRPPASDSEGRVVGVCAGPQRAPGSR